MKACTKCKVEQPFTSFHKHKKRSDGLRAQCKACVAEYGADYHTDPAHKLRHRAKVAFNLGFTKATKHNDGMKPFISADEKEMMRSFIAAAKELSALTGIAYEVDHIIPLSKGGEHRLRNLQCITKDDNKAKRDSLNFTAYTQQPSYPRPEDIAACEEGGMKKCKKCSIEQPLTEYNMDNSQADSLTTQCKSCFQAYRDKERAERLAEAVVVKAIAAKDAELEAKYERINYEARKFLLGYS